MSGSRRRQRLRLEALENAAGPDPYRLEPLDPEHHFPTLFERKFRARGLPIHYFYYRKRSQD